jgi:hypothetical protein
VIFISADEERAAAIAARKEFAKTSAFKSIII